MSTSVPVGLYDIPYIYIYIFFLYTVYTGRIGRWQVPGLLALEAAAGGGGRETRQRSSDPLVRYRTLAHALVVSLQASTCMCPRHSQLCRSSKALLLLSHSPLSTDYMPLDHHLTQQHSKQPRESRNLVYYQV